MKIQSGKKKQWWAYRRRCGEKEERREVGGVYASKADKRAFLIWKDTRCTDKSRECEK
jgi:hypothetical protein